MSPSLLAILNRIDQDTYRLHHTTRTRGDLARYPRDYFRPVELLHHWNGNPGRFGGSSASADWPRGDR